MQLFAVPLQRHGLGRVLGGKLFAQIGGLALGGRVKAEFQLLAQLFAPFPGIAQGDFGINANGEGFFPTSLPIPHSPSVFSCLWILLDGYGSRKVWQPDSHLPGLRSHHESVRQHGKAGASSGEIGHHVSAGTGTYK